MGHKHLSGNPIFTFLIAPTQLGMYPARHLTRVEAAISEQLLISSMFQIIGARDLIPTVSSECGKVNESLIAGGNRKVGADDGLAVVDRHAAAAAG